MTWSTSSHYSTPKAKFTVAELGRICQYPWEDLDVSVKRFLGKALGVLVDMCLHSMIEDSRIDLEICCFFLIQVNGGPEA